MSFHFCSHAWEVSDLDHGTVVRLRNRDLGLETVPVLVDELLVLVQESGKPNLYLDFADIGLVSDEAMSKLGELNDNLRKQGSQLILLNLNSTLRNMVETMRPTNAFDVRAVDAAGAIA